MTIIFADSFESLTTATLRARYDDAGLNAAISTTYFRTGARALGLPAGYHVTKNITATAGIVVGGCFMRSSGGGAQWTNMITLLTGATQVVTLKHGPAASPNTLELLLGAVGSEVALGNWVHDWSYLTWHYIELVFTMADSGGIAQVWVDGILRIAYAGDTKPAGDTTFNRVRLQGTNTNMANHYVDDFYIGTARLGPLRIYGLLPNGDGAKSEWTPSAGANYECVDEIGPNDDTDTVSAGAVGLTDLYTVAGLAAGTRKVLAVQESLRAKASDASARSIAAVISQGGVESAGGELVLTTAYATHYQMWETTNPATGLPWTRADIAAAQWGVKVTV